MTEPRTSTNQMRHKTPALKASALNPFFLTADFRPHAASVARNCSAIGSHDARFALQLRTYKALIPCGANSLRCRKMRYTFSGGLSSLARGHLVSILF